MVRKCWRVEAFSLIFPPEIIQIVSDYSTIPVEGFYLIACGFVCHLPERRESIIPERYTANLVVHPSEWSNLGDLDNDDCREYEVALLSSKIFMHLRQHHYNQSRGD